MPSDSELVDSEAKLAKDIWKMVKDDAFLTGFFKDKESFVVHLVKKAILLYSDFDNTVGLQNIVLLSIKIAMYQQVFYCGKLR